MYFTSLFRGPIDKDEELIRRLFYLLCTVLCGCILVFGYTAAQREIAANDTAPIESLKHDFGVVQTNMEVSHVFVFQNPMDFAIRPSRVHASCSCVSAFVERKPIRPGENMEVKVVLQTPQKASRLKQTLKVHFDGPESQPLELNVHATVKPELFVSADRIAIGYTAGEGATSATFRVSNFGAQRWKSVRVEADVDWLDAHCQEEVQQETRTKLPLQEWVCRLKLNPAALPAGTHHAMLTVSSIPSSKSATIPVELNLVPGVVAFPGTWYSFATEGGAPESRSKIVLRSDLSSDCKLRCVASESLDKFLSLKLIRTDDDRPESVYSLTGTWDRMPETETAGQVEVLWSVGRREHVLTIPVLFVPAKQ